MIANQKDAYTLSDRGTFLATKNLDSKILVQGDPQLQNPYHVIVVKHPGTNVGCAKAFSDWITSAPDAEADRRSSASAKYGQALFHPDAAGSDPPSATLLWELVARSALVSMSATAIAMAIGISGRHRARVAALPRPAIGGHGRQHRHGAAHGGRRPGRGARAVSQRPARDR